MNDWSIPRRQANRFEERAQDAASEAAFNQLIAREKQVSKTGGLEEDIGRIAVGEAEQIATVTNLETYKAEAHRSETQ